MPNVQSTATSTPTTARKHKRIGLLWHSVKSGNLGVGALTVCNIFIVEQVARDIGVDVSFRILGWKDPNPEQIKQPNLSLFEMRGKQVVNPAGLLKEARACDLVLDISGGDSFADIYGRHRFAYNIAGKLAVILARTPLINSPQTIGPFKLWWARKAATMMMRLSKAVVTRDKLSTDYANSLGIRNIVEATDVAMRLPYDKPAPNNTGKLKIGFNVSGLLFENNNRHGNMVVLKSNYDDIARNLVGYFAKRPDCELHLISHVVGKNEDDFEACEKLSKEFPNTILVKRFPDPSAAKTYIAGLDYFFGARMHACIAAFSSGVPVVSTAYSRKFEGLFSTLGYPHTVDCITSTTEEVVNKVIWGFENRQLLKKEVADCFKNADARLKKYEAVIREQLLKP
jgi:colanic acid/amylovoran biosynthesis protein